MPYAPLSLLNTNVYKKNVVQDHKTLCKHVAAMEMVYITSLRRTLASSPESECDACCQQWHTGSKTLLQQNPPVLNWGRRLTQVDPFNGRVRG